MTVIMRESKLSSIFNAPNSNTESPVASCSPTLRVGWGWVRPVLMMIVRGQAYVSIVNIICTATVPPLLKQVAELFTTRNCAVRNTIYNCSQQMPDR